MKKQEEKRTDDTLVALAQTGDTNAEQELLERYGNLVRFCACKFFLMGGETEDLVQEGMLGLHQAITTYQECVGKSFKNYAYLCVWRRIIDAVKKASSNKNAPLNTYVSMTGLKGVFPDGSPEDLVIADDDRRELNKMMSRVLTDIEFKAFTMFMDGVTIAEICEMTGKSPKSVDNAIQRSKKKLINALKTNNEG